MKLKGCFLLKKLTVNFCYKVISAQLFHSLANTNAKKHFVAALIKEDGTITTTSFGDI